MDMQHEEHLLFCSARADMMTALRDWLLTHPKVGDVQSEIVATANMVRQLAVLMPRGD
jgi:hypothetical protein